MPAGMKCTGKTLHYKAVLLIYLGNHSCAVSAENMTVPCLQRRLAPGLHARGSGADCYGTSEASQECGGRVIFPSHPKQSLLCRMYFLSSIDVTLAVQSWLLRLHGPRVAVSKFGSLYTVLDVGRSCQRQSAWVQQEARSER